MTDYRTKGVPVKFIQPGFINNRLTYTGEWKSTDRSIEWLAICSCGRNHWIPYAKIIYTKSCGCLVSEAGRNARKAKTGKFILGAFLDRFKFSAKTRKLSFDIDLDFLDELWEKQGGKCFYSGESLTLPKYATDCTKKDKYTASLDRINSNIGYEKGNIVFCTKNINIMKMCLSSEKFIRICKAVADRH